MRCFPILLALLLFTLTTTANAEKTACYPPHALIHGLLLQGFLPRVEIEVDKNPGMIFIHPSGSFVVFVLVGKQMCEIAHGRAWNEIKWRDA